MSDHVKQVLLFAAGLMFTIGAILLYLTSYHRLDNAGKDLLKQEERQQYLVESYALTRYDQCTIYGSQAISYLKTNWESFGEVYLDSGGGPVLVSDDEHFRTAGHIYYIYGNGLYFVSLGYNANGIPDTVTVTLKGFPEN